MKKGLLIVSFGTSYRDAYANDIAPVERALAAAFPECVCLCAYASTVILRKLKSREDLTLPGISEGLDALAAQGVRELLVQPTFLIPGIEYEKMVSIIQDKRSLFDTVRVGAPLLSGDSDYARIASCMQAVHSPREGALVLMGHGTDHAANSAYARLEAAFAEAGHTDVFIGTVEGTPCLEDLLPRLAPYSQVIVAPLLLVAGDHAKNDMAGDSPDSWRSRLIGAGHEAECFLRGMGSFRFTRELLIAHAKAAEFL